MIGMLNCMARWYSTPGSLARCVGTLPPYPSLAAGIAVGVVHTKCVVSISIRSLHLAPISLRACFASSKRLGSSTVPKQTETPRVSSIVCVRVVTMLEGKLPAVVRRMSWNVYGVLIESPESFVEVFSKGLGMRARRALLR